MAGRAHLLLTRPRPTPPRPSPAPPRSPPPPPAQPGVHPSQPELSSLRRVPGCLPPSPLSPVPRLTLPSRSTAPLDAPSSSLTSLSEHKTPTPNCPYGANRASDEVALLSASSPPPGFLPCQLPQSAKGPSRLLLRVRSSTVLRAITYPPPLAITGPSPLPCHTECPSDLRGPPRCPLGSPFRALSALARRRRG